MTAPLLIIEQAEAFERDHKLRLPFRFGVITLREVTEVFVRVRLRDAHSGVSAEGYAAELMVPKWFDKSPSLSETDNVKQLRRSVSTALKLSLAEPGPMTAADHAWHLDARQRTELAGENGLVAGFGPALLACACLDALGHLEQLSFAQLMQRNRPGLSAAHLPEDLAGFDINTFLADLKPQPSIALRHTVGLADALTPAELESRLNDGLPETLSEVIERYQPGYFKVKVSGELDTDLQRLIAIAGQLEPLPNYRLTLDGNEQFSTAAAFSELLDAIEATPQLRRLRQSILFVEQPLHREHSLDTPVHDLARRIPLLIDESDADLDSFRRARELGYRGVSSKACKGLYRSLINAMRCQHDASAGCFLSAEDLTTQAGLAVQQDLALVGLLGLGHVERNGHHFVGRLDGAPATEVDAFATAHPSLYQRDDKGLSLRIQQGRIALDSLAGAGFASGAVPAFAGMRALTQHDQEEPQ